MTSKTPFISVVVPTFHRNDLLHKCLTCLSPSRQHLDALKYEVIVSDDGVKTTAERMVHDQFPWARWIAGPHRGPAANRNNGVKYALGPWLAFTDDDCLPKPEWLSAFAAAIHDGTEVYEGKTTCEVGVSSPLESAPVNETGGWLWSCNMLVRESIFEVLSGFDESFPAPHMEDVDFRERVRKAGYNFEFVATAIIDHPPRRVLWGHRASMPLESEMLFWYKQGNRKPHGRALVLQTARYRIGNILKIPILFIHGVL